MRYEMLRSEHTTHGCTQPHPSFSNALANASFPAKKPISFCHPSIGVLLIKRRLEGAHRNAASNQLRIQLPQFICLLCLHDKLFRCQGTSPSAQLIWLRRPGDREEERLHGQPKLTHSPSAPFDQPIVKDDQRFAMRYPQFVQRWRGAEQLFAPSKSSGGDQPLQRAEYVPYTYSE
jgi:hypothetical protein